MDPNTNQPPRPQPGQIANSQPFTPPRLQPDWQQGLGGVQTSQQPSMPGQVPQPPAQAIPRAGELPTPTPVGEGQPQPAPWTPPTPPAPPVTPSVMTPPTPSMGSGMPGESRSRAKEVLAIASMLVVAALLAGAAYLFFTRDSDKKTDTHSSNSQAVDLATINNAMLLPPDNIPGFQGRQTGVASIKDYVSNDKSCELITGTTSAAQLPGTDLNSIVQPQVDQLKKAGATVKGPSSGTSLVLKDSEDNSKTYNLPTVKYEFSQDKKHAVVHYSAVILNNGDRVVVNRNCVNQNGDVDAAKINNLDALAKDIKVLAGQK